jgi:hypothetical protein
MFLIAHHVLHSQFNEAGTHCCHGHAEWILGAGACVSAASHVLHAAWAFEFLQARRSSGCVETRPNGQLCGLSVTLRAWVSAWET